MLAVWAANDGLHAAERPAGAPGFGDLGVILAKAGTSDPQVAFFADGRAAAKATYTGGFAGVVRQSGADSFVPTEFGLATTINGSDMTVSDQTGEVVIALAIKTGSTSQVLLARVSSNGMADRERLRSADGHEQHVQQHELLRTSPRASSRTTGSS